MQWEIIFLIARFVHWEMIATSIEYTKSRKWTQTMLLHGVTAEQQTYRIALCFAPRIIEQKETNKWASFKTITANKKHFLRSAFCFGNEAHLRCMKNEAGLRPMKRGFATRKGNTALCFMFAKQTLHGNEVAASYLQSKCFISKDGASLTKHWIYANVSHRICGCWANLQMTEVSVGFQPRR